MKTEEIKVIRQVLKKNLDQAEVNRKLFGEKKIVCVNIMGTPGAGKTTLIETMVKEARGTRFGVVEGDFEGTKDTRRLQPLGIPVIQINCRTCHLTADFVAEGLKELPLDRLDVVLIENIGNLICPAAYDLGEAIRLVLLSIPEGDDKPEKYPQIFSVADMVVLTKSDLLPAFDYSLDAVKSEIRKVNPKAPVVLFSSKQPETIRPVLDFIHVQK